MVLYIHCFIAIRLKAPQSTLYSAPFIEEETEVKCLVQDFPAPKKQGQDETQVCLPPDSPVPYPWQWSLEPEEAWGSFLP